MSTETEHYIDLTVFDDHGETVGTVTDVIVDPHNLEPEFLTVKTGRFALFSGDHLLPVVVVDRRGDQLVVPFERDLVERAPSTRDHTPPDAERRREISLHYGI